ncbi:hypothetical protein WA026_011414 [Henosepilachna vigintioctopunctata]|uniref:Uncharacterized protein n=1 Tax=Henosepilachna vigintioctopunctata TaxID=420089 RepID=A0AAW1TKR3_9CUCU
MATTKISFYCAEKETLVDLEVSPADAERALTDSVFPNKLISEKLNQQSPSTSATVDNDLSFFNETCLDIGDTGDLNSETHQKKDHEEQRRKRHKERMEMDENFLKVLEKLANK